jgi:hypothetical protein
VLAVGALAVGGAKLPWGGFVGLDVGAEDCVTLEASAPIVASGVSAMPSLEDGQVDSSFVVSTMDGEQSVTVLMRGAVPVLVDATTARIETLSDGSYGVVFADGTTMRLDLRFDDGGLSAVYYAPVIPQDDQGVSFAPEIGGPTSGAAMEAASPSLSLDCVTPTPRATSSHVSPEGPDPAADIPGSPFSFGTALETEEYRSEKLFIDTVEWVPVDQMNRRLELGYGETEGVPRALGAGPVVTVEVVDRVGGFSGVTGATGGSVDPVLHVAQGFIDPQRDNVSLVFGWMFVAVRDGIVVGKVRASGSEPMAPPMTYGPGFGAENQHTYTLLNPEGNFLDANGEVLTGEWDTYIVVGSGYFDETGEFTGLEYAWKKLEPPA